MLLKRMKQRMVIMKEKVKMVMTIMMATLLKMKTQPLNCGQLGD
jgi:hypothetical protein